MMNIYDVLQHVKKRPSMYLGVPSVFCLKSFLNGYLLARSDLSFPLTQEEQDFENFQNWIQERFNVESSQSWATIIRFYSIDERDALENFFKWFEEFQNRDKNHHGSDSEK